LCVIFDSIYIYSDLPIDKDFEQERKNYMDYDFYYHVGAERYVRRGIPEETIRGYGVLFDHKTQKYYKEGSMTIEEKQDQFIRYMKNSDWEQAYKCNEWLLEFPHTLVTI